MNSTARVRKPVRLLFGPTFAREPRAFCEPRRNPYLDSVQMGVQCRGTFDPLAWDDLALPSITGQLRVHDSFSPTKLIADEQIIATFSNEAGEQGSVAVDVDHAGDLLLVGTFAGTRNLFPNAPCQETAISCSAISARSLANDVSWPRIPAGVDLTVTFAIRSSVLCRAEAPEGFTTLVSIEVIGCLNLFGTKTKD